MNQISNSYQTQKQQIEKETKGQQHLSLLIIILTSFLAVVSYLHSNIIALIGFTLISALAMSGIYIDKKWQEIRLKDLDHSIRGIKKGEPTLIINEQPLGQRNRSAFRLVLSQLFLGTLFSLITSILIIARMTQTSDQLEIGLMVATGIGVAILLIVCLGWTYRLISYRKKVANLISNSENKSLDQEIL